jgi:alkanesulfonate monooxygenase SsuD/methylene tetrahydromethanopterin reductase-like flavin-dependent oxidoreductase (luciferase family)
MLGIGAGYQPYEFERFGVDIVQNLEMTDEFCDILDLAFSGDFFSYNGKHYQMPENSYPGPPGATTAADLRRRPYPGDVPRCRAARLSGADVGPGRRRQIAGRAVCGHRRRVCGRECAVSRAHVTVNRFAHITDSREAGMRFAENARYQSRLASSLRRRQEVMQGTVLVDVPFPDEPPLETIYNDLLIGDVETVAERLVAEIHATKPVHVCFSFKVGNTPHAAAMRSMELMIGEVKPRVEKALGPLE